MLFSRVIIVTYEAIRTRCGKFGQDYANQIRLCRLRPGNKWQLIPQDNLFLIMTPLELYPSLSSLPTLSEKDNGPGVSYNSEVLATKTFFIKLLADEGDIVLDPFGGSNTTGVVAEKLERSEIVKEYLKGGSSALSERPTS